MSKKNNLIVGKMGESKAIEYLKAIPEDKNFAIKLEKAKKANGRTLVQPRAGVPLIHDHIVLLQHLEEYVKVMGKYNKTVVSLFKSLINDLPVQAEAAAKIIDNFNPEKFKEVIEFAKAANGGRAIQ